MKVIIESPYSGNRWQNMKYGFRSMRDSIDRGEAPVLFHLLYPVVLDDDVPAERSLGIHRSQLWYSSADLVAVYTDLGISAGMREGIAFAESLGLRLEYRSLYANL